MPGTPNWEQFMAALRRDEEASPEPPSAALDQVDAQGRDLARDFGIELDEQALAGALWALALTDLIAFGFEASERGGWVTSPSDENRVAGMGVVRHLAARRWRQGYQRRSGKPSNASE